MNNPFTLNNETYCTCMRCGARRHFNLGRSKMTGSYYYAPSSTLYDYPQPIQAFSVTEGEQTGAIPQKLRVTSAVATA